MSIRNKGEILSEVFNNKAAPPEWDATALLHERLILEVLIDIRDTIKEGLDDIDSAIHIINIKD